MSELSAWKKYKQHIGDARPWDLLDHDKKTTDEVIASRIGICNSCEKFINLTKQCRLCGCFMPLKVTIEIASCPIGKW